MVTACVETHDEVCWGQVSVDNKRKRRGQQGQVTQELGGE